MKKVYFMLAVVGAFLVGFFVACGDELYSSNIQRIVYEVSEANVTAAGGYIDVPVLHVGTAGKSGAGEMASVVVYGNGRGANNQWTMLTSTVLHEGRVWIEYREYESYYYRVVAVY
jgi:hypothetical protein